jgi:DNA-binding Lrp family transcriptional regulator
MDKLDVKIIRELFQPTPFVPSREGQRESFRAMGKKLGVSDGVVAKRVGRLARSGFIKGFPLLLNMDLLGLKVGVVVLDVEASTPRKELARKLSLIDGLIIVQVHLLGSVGVIFCCKDDESLQRKADLISTVAGARSARLTHIPFPKSTVSLSKSDWMIISRLQGNVDMPFGEISEELKISTRTVRRRMARMTEGGVIFTLASVDVKAIREAIMADLVVEYDSPNLRPQVDKTLLELLEPYYFSTGLWEGYGLFSLILPNLFKSREILETVKRAKGIKSAMLELVEDRYEFYDYVYDAVNRNLAALKLISPEKVDLGGKLGRNERSDTFASKPNQTLPSLHHDD